MLFVTHYSVDLRFNNADVAFVPGSFCLGRVLGLEGYCITTLVKWATAKYSLKLNDTTGKSC